MIIAILVILSFIAGYGLAVFLIARDRDLIRLKPDEVVTKKPADGLVLVSVPPHIMRKLVTHPDGFDPNEARSMARKKDSSA